MSDYHSLLSSVIFLRALLDLDWQVARSIQGFRCPECGGPLHWAPYPRVPRGLVPAVLTEAFSRRWSLCCGAEGCRKRTTPPSVCFLGRRQFIGATFIVLSLLRRGVTPETARELRASIPVESRTLERWRRWWSRQLPTTQFWRAVAGRFAPSVATEEMPASLVKRFMGDAAARLKASLRFLSPLTTSSIRLESSLAMVS